MVEVYTSDEFNEWFDGLVTDDRKAVGRVVERLESRGVGLGFPHSSDIKGTRYPLRELRVQSKGHVLRVIYAFDPDRDAYLILGGDKTGDARFYERIIPVAERIWVEYFKRFL
jgi:hypothetical protein